MNHQHSEPHLQALFSCFVPLRSFRSLVPLGNLPLLSSSVNGELANRHQERAREEGRYPAASINFSFVADREESY